jgi:hypothetical protein
MDSWRDVLWRVFRRHRRPSDSEDARRGRAIPTQARVSRIYRHSTHHARESEPRAVAGEPYTENSNRYR